MYDDKTEDKAVLPPPSFVVEPVETQRQGAQIVIQANEFYSTKDSPEYGKPKMESQDKDVDLSSIKFAKEVMIDFIVSVDYRILCRFLGVTGVKEVKSFPYVEIPLVSLLLMQVLVNFMESIGYTYSGELNFNRQGDSIPCEKIRWSVGNEEFLFTTTGFMYFERMGKKKENIVFYLHSELREHFTSIVCYTKDKKQSEDIMVGLEDYAKLHNCLRGAKIRDVDLFKGLFTEVRDLSKYSWKDYYFSQKILDLLDLEVFGFMKDVKKYGKEGITKRGVILHGRPGVGKTTIGYITCNYASESTVIWVTPEVVSNENGNSFRSIKELYKLVDFVSPCILILEDLDLFTEDRDLGKGSPVLGALMNVLDGIGSVENAVTIGITNRLDCIEKALRNRPGRFDRLIEIPALDKELRKKMFCNRLSEWKVSKETMEYVVSKTDGWTGAEVQEFVNTLSLDFLRDGGFKGMDNDLVDKIVKTLTEFGAGGEGAFGFGNRE